MEKRRILSLDILRGLGIMVIVVIHRIHYTWTGMRNTELLREQFSGPWAPVLVFTIILFTMAGIFYFISGLANAYAIHTRIASGKTTPAKAALWGAVGGLWIFFMNYVQRIFFMNGFQETEPFADPKFPIGLITSWVRNPDAVSFSWSQITDPGTLALIGMVIFFVSLFLGLMLSFPRIFTPRKLNIILFSLAAMAFLVSPFSKYYLRPVYDNMCELGNYFGAACIGQVCNEFGLLPYLGYGFIGAIIGIGISLKEAWKKHKQQSLFMAIVFVAAGALSLFIFDREDAFEKGCIGSGICLLELGIFILLQLWFYKMFDRTTNEKTSAYRNKTKNIRRFGMLALSVYILEPLVAELFRKLVDLFAGKGWEEQLQHVLLFGLFLLLLWSLILKLWERVNFIGSLEWLSVAVLRSLTGKKSGKTNFKS